MEVKKIETAYAVIQDSNREKSAEGSSDRSSETAAKLQRETAKTEAPTGIPKPYSLYGKYYDYTVNSDHELVIKVRERFTGKEIRQIPTKEALAIRHGLRKVMELFIDETV